MPKKKRTSITGRSERKRKLETVKKRIAALTEEELLEKRSAAAERRKLQRQQANDDELANDVRDSEAEQEKRDEEESKQRRLSDAGASRKKHGEVEMEEMKREQPRATAAERKRKQREKEDEETKQERRLEDLMRKRKENLNEEQRKKLEEKIAIRDTETISAREDRLRAGKLRQKKGVLYNIGRSGDVAAVDQHSCGSMSNTCDCCQGLFFSEERNTRCKYVHCCHSGKIVEEGKSYPPELRDLISGNHPLSEDFLKDIRSYNSLLSFASMGANVDTQKGHGYSCFRIHGAIYHRTSHLHPLEPGQEKYAQLYILDSDEALKQRIKMTGSVALSRGILTLLDAVIREVNPFAKAYKMLNEFERETLKVEGVKGVADIRMYIKDDNLSKDEHKGRFNPPKQNEVAVIFKTSDGVPPSNRDIVIHPKSGGLINVSTLNPNLEPMTYVLFFPYGDKGFQVQQGHTELQFYCHRVSPRRGIFNPVLYGRKLFQQYLVDSYVKVEGNRLHYLRKHQKNLRVETYMGLSDHVYKVSRKLGLKPGLPVILPSTFIGSARSMQQNYQDSMAIVRDFGKPDLFVTFTCNPRWPEITSNLLPGQKPHDRPDIVARVFDIKKTALLEDLKKNRVLGVVVADIYVIEFQKRGLPHMHLLMILAEEDKITDTASLDKCVCAELPDESVDPALHRIVKSSMIHGPCGDLNKNSSCMSGGICCKGYPKAFQEESKLNVAAYPLYRRRDDGKFVTVKNKVVDNRWVVPYNPFLTKKYATHINVEVCSSIKSVKYLFKYVYKGHDAAKVVIEESGDSTLLWDEIKNFLNARYVSAPEAVWRLFEKKMHDKSHTIIRLPVHLENLQPVYFEDDEEREALLKAAQRDTMLTGWFRLNAANPDAGSYLYSEIPKHFTWNNYAWRKRVKLGDNVLTRMYSVSPKDVERFHLRLLLCHVKGAKSFEELKTYNNVIHPTFKEACRARNLLQDDKEWNNCLAEAASFKMPSQLRQLFVFILVFCNPTDALALWNEFKDSLSEDFSRFCSSEDSHGLALRSMEDHLKMHGVSLERYGLPKPPTDAKVTPLAPLYDAAFEKERGDELKKLLNEEQKCVYDAVMEAVEDENCGSPKTFCVNAFAGAGKTFLFNAILHSVRGMGRVAVAVAWTGIASILLNGGRTVHSTFKLPVPVLENSTCHIRQDSEEGKRLKASRLIAWDECTMTPHNALEAADRLLRDLTGLDVPFGAKVVLLGGDWRQTLPVVSHGSRSSIIENCIRNSHLWPHFKQFTLSKNMRLRPEEQEFSEWLVRLGDGKLGNDCGFEEDVIELPPSCIVKGSLVQEMFGKEEFDAEDLGDKAILCPKNEEALKMNEAILKRFPGEVFTFYSADSIVCEDEEEQDTFQLDFIHSLTPSGMPPHCLNLKVGVPIMLLRNLNPSLGLCNGTRLTVQRIMTNVLDCKVLSGENAGSRVFIPRVELTPSDTNLPFQLKRRQFPIRLAFCMTINKSQGQTLKKVGIYLPRPVFSHGMLYVAFSRCTSMRSVRVLVKNTSNQGCLIPDSDRVFTKNVVYREVLEDTASENDGKSSSRPVEQELETEVEDFVENEPEARATGVRNITEEEMQTLASPEGYLEDSHINLFGNIVNSETSFGMQDVLLLHVPDSIAPIAPGQRNLQILFSSHPGSSVGHWICTYYDGERNHVYDSLNRKFLEEDHKLYLHKLYGSHVQNVFHDVQQQENQYDCGVFAIAFAVSLCLGRDPSSEVYDKKNMRKHAARIFISKTLMPFPTA